MKLNHHEYLNFDSFANPKLIPFFAPSLSLHEEFVYMGVALNV